MRRFARIRWARLVTSIAGACMTASACTDAPGRAPATVTDSAGIEIVHSAAPAWRAGEGWAVGADPSVEIGVVEGERAYQLDRVTDAALLSDGRIVVANAGSAELRAFDPGGRHLWTTGGSGEGPGEFRVVAHVWRLPGDSILAFDAGLARLSLFGPRGAFVRTIALEARAGEIPAHATDRFEDGGLLAIRGEGVMWRPGEEGRVEPGEWIFERFAANGRFEGEIARYPTSPQWALQAAGRPRLEYLPFVNEMPARAAGQGRLYVGGGGSFSIDARAVDGGLVRIIRWDAEPRPVGEAETVRYREHRLGRVQDEDLRRGLAAFLDEVPFPDRMPAYQTLLVDELGHLWAERYRAPWERRPRWSVFDSEARWLGDVETPAGVRVLRIGSDAILGLRRDELDVEHVVVHELSRGRS